MPTATLSVEEFVRRVNQVLGQGKLSFQESHRLSDPAGRFQVEISRIDGSRSVRAKLVLGEEIDPSLLDQLSGSYNLEASLPTHGFFDMLTILPNAKALEATLTISLRDANSSFRYRLYKR
jgi:hypothetical protein